MLKDGERLDRLEREGLGIIQSPQVFSFSMDAVLLADFAAIAHTRPAKIVDLCAGNGAVSLMLSAKTKNPILGIEIQEELVDMAERSIELNQLQEQVHILQGDVRQLSSLIEKDSVDFITCNPPYFKALESNQVHKKLAHTLARHEIFLPLEELLSAISQVLKMRGKAYLVHRPDRLSDIIDLARKYRLEPKRIRFVHPRAYKEANILLIELMKDASPGGAKVLPPLIVFEAEQVYTQEVREIYYGSKS